MSRFPPIPEDQLSDTQKSAHNGIDRLFSNFPSHLIRKNADGVIFGPYSSLFYTEDISDSWLALALNVMRQQRFTFREKELAIIAVLSEYDVPYVLYAHSEIAIHAGFTKEQTQQAFHGQLPTGLDARESAVYNLALKLTKLRSPMDDEDFQQARSILGKDGVAGIAHIVSGYIYVVMLSNISGAGAPEPTEGMYQATRNPNLTRH